MDMMRLRSQRALAASVLLAGFALPGMALSQSEDVLRVAISSDLQNLDPTVSVQGVTVNHGYMVYDTLFGLDENYLPQPQMVGDWSLSEDELTYTFSLRDGLRFHDGTAVTSADAVASIKRWGEVDGSGQLLLERTSEIRSVDDMTFEIELIEPYGLVIDSLAKPDAYPLFVLPAANAEKASREQITDAIGSGPFKFVHAEWVPGSKVVYERNDDYVPRDEPASFYAGGKVVHFDRVEWNVLRDPQTALAALQSNEIDYWENPPSDLLPVIKAADDLDIVIHDPLGNYQVFRINHLQPPFDDPKAREAIMWLVNQEDYLKAISSDPALYRECGAMFVGGSANESDAGNEAIVTHDPARAVELFKEAGWDGTTPIQMFLPTDRPEYNAVILVLADAFRQIGFAVDVQAMDWATVGQRRANRGPVAEGGWNIAPTATGGFISSSPATSLFSFTCEKGWAGWPCSERVEELRDEFLLASDAVERKRIIDEMQTEMFAAGVYVPVGQVLIPAAKRSDIVDFPQHAMPGGTLFWGVRRAE